MPSSPFLQNLRCPVTGALLEVMSPELLSEAQERMEGDGLFTRMGVRVSGPLAAALINADRTWVYPMVHGIPQMLADEAVAWTTIPSNDNRAARPT